MIGFLDLPCRILIILELFFRTEEKIITALREVGT